MKKVNAKEKMKEICFRVSSKTLYITSVACAFNIHFTVIEKKKNNVQSYFL